MTAGTARKRRVVGRKRRWSAGVKTVSTAPPPGTFTKPAEQIARTMARKDVSPKGIGSGIRMIQFFINRAGKQLPARQRRELERAKRILQERSARAREGATKADEGSRRPTRQLS